MSVSHIMKLSVLELATLVFFVVCLRLEHLFLINLTDVRTPNTSTLICVMLLDIRCDLVPLKTFILNPWGGVKNPRADDV